MEDRGLIKRKRQAEKLRRIEKNESKASEKNIHSLFIGLIQTNELYGDVAPVPALHLSVPHRY